MDYPSLWHSWWYRTVDQSWFKILFFLSITHTELAQSVPGEEPTGSVSAAALWEEREETVVGRTGPSSEGSVYTAAASSSSRGEIPTTTTLLVRTYEDIAGDLATLPPPPCTTPLSSSAGLSVGSPQSWVTNLYCWTTRTNSSDSPQVWWRARKTSATMVMFSLCQHPGLTFSGNQIISYHVKPKIIYLYSVMF